MQKTQEQLTQPAFNARLVTSIGEISQSAWDALQPPKRARLEGSKAGKVESDSQLEETHYNPFLSYNFLHALEYSQSAVRETGWMPQHLLIEDDQDDLVAAMPCYLKNHSRGEYVFDYAWADAYERAGGRYYPKLQASVPFTPATTPSVLIKPGQDASALRQLAASVMAEITDKQALSSVHATFIPEHETSDFKDTGYLLRTDRQYHWVNRGYETYDDFLATLASRKRKTLKRERRDALANDISIEWLTGSDITEEHWDIFWTFYQDTGARKWGTPYFTRDCFSMLGQTMADELLLVFAKRNDRPIAGALNVIGDDTLYGRYWGCIEDHRFLHFEVCYHQAIDYALAHGLSRVEAGAQGEHKLARGYEPVTTHSAHWISHPGLRDAVAHFLAQERQHVALENEALKDYTPYRKNDEHSS